MSLDTLDNLVKNGAKLTPMMKQYYEIKRENKDKIVLFRMGDFYEVFFEDAITLAKILNIAQTHRGKIGNTPVPMAGIPHHAAPNYVDRLTTAGKRVAICEQVQDPKDAIGIVKRAVTQVVSPGVPYDLNQADHAQNFYLCSAFVEDSLYSVSFIDFSTGKFFGFDGQPKEEFLNLLGKYAPKEIVAYPGQFARDKEIETYIENLGILRNILSEDYFHPINGDHQLKRFIPNYEQDKIIEKSPRLKKSLCALTNYFGNTQGDIDLNHLEEFRFISTENFLKVSTKTLEGLEIIPKDAHSKRSSILGLCDKTMTSMGKRHLKKIFLHPLKIKNQIIKRQSFIETILKKTDILFESRNYLSNIRDIERILTKVTLGKATSHDLINFSESFYSFLELKKVIYSSNLDKFLSMEMTGKQITSLEELSLEFFETFNSEPSASIEKRNLIKHGFNKKRDHLWELSENSEKSFDDLEKKYLSTTDIPKLKIKHNNIHGHFIEVSKTHSHKVPPSFVRRQTLVNSERYTTEELDKLDKDSAFARERLQEVEREILNSCLDKLKSNSKDVINLCRVIEEIDTLQSLAQIAHTNSWTKPEISSEEQHFQMTGAWHPLIKKIIGESFVTHDLNLNKNCFFGLITGPNMAGKTTVMREVAIIQLLMQIGSFVPAKKACLSLSDFIFSRLGASDNIQQGQSTFMVEMSETAEITRHATKKSLVILDEIGRGTSTYDGLSIAWSLVNYFNSKIKCRTLFASHYHELIDVIENLPTAKNLTVRTKKVGERVDFLYELIEKGANQSFGIYVARLAGLPKSVLIEASNILHQLEKEKSQPKESNNQLTFFDFNNEKAQLQEPRVDLKSLDAINELKSININNLSPIDSLLKIKELQDQLH
tara:strand:- start:7552 stop:10200 length:2649 start_codon:yes stop_codon:yes gene_type:complete